MTGKQKSVLLVDDDAIFCAICERHFSGTKHSELTTVNTIADSEEILRSEHAPDVLLLDLSLPEKDGIEFVRELKDLKFKGKVIIVSSQPSNVIDMACKLAATCGIEVAGTFEKPLTQSSFAELDEMIQSD